MTKTARNHSNTVKKQRRMSQKSLDNLKPFMKGDDPRRNMNGRPKSFDQLRALFQDIAAEEIKVKGKAMTRAEFIGIEMSKNRKMMKEFLEFAYGKVPQAVEVNGNDDKPITIKVVYADDNGNNPTTP